jgi:hypothetical protein
MISLYQKHDYLFGIWLLMQKKPQSFYISTSFTTDAKASKSMLVKPSGYEKQRAVTLQFMLMGEN